MVHARVEHGRRWTEEQLKYFSDQPLWYLAISGYLDQIICVWPVMWFKSDARLGFLFTNTHVVVHSYFVKL